MASPHNYIKTKSIYHFIYIYIYKKINIVRIAQPSR